MNNYKFMVFGFGDKTVDISLQPGNIPPVVHVSQYDTNREITFRFDDEINASYCRVEGTRSDGGTVYEDIDDFDGGYSVTWEPSSQFTALKGDCVCELVFSGDSTFTYRTGSCNFILRVEPAARDTTSPAAMSAVTITKNGVYNVRPYAEARIAVSDGEGGGGGGEVVADMKLLSDLSASAPETTYDVDMTDYPISKTRDYAFYACKALKSVKIDVKTVGSSSFESCTAMQSVHLYNTQNINSGAFRGCYSLAALYLHGDSVASLSSVSVLNSTAIADGTGTIYVPSNLVSSYRNATNWSTFASQIQSIP